MRERSVILINGIAKEATFYSSALVNIEDIYINI
jgi:hypothetical protein